MNQQDATRIKELGLVALKNPNLRKEALLELRQYDTPIINEVLEHVTQRNDLKGKRPPAPGTPIVILYYNDRQYILL